MFFGMEARIQSEKAFVSTVKSGWGQHKRAEPDMTLINLDIFPTKHTKHCLVLCASSQGKSQCNSKAWISSV